MDVKKAIETRKSVRSYKSEPIDEKIIKELIEAAHLAPTGNNSQPQRFYIIKTEEDKKKLKENNIFMQEFVYQAPIVIVCAADPRVYVKKVEGWDSDNKTRAIRDISIASGFLVLRATELGLGACFVGWINKEKIKKILNIPEDYLVPYVITVGYSNEGLKERVRKDLKDIILN